MGCKIIVTSKYSWVVQHLTTVSAITFPRKEEGMIFPNSALPLNTQMFFLTIFYPKEQNSRVLSVATAGGKSEKVPLCQDYINMCHDNLLSVPLFEAIRNV
ncbi:UNVERIFIED_CONTAM: hypothetical protein K2H54_043719 [Gekko kuhli]